jgi:hypothetical protein
LNRDIAVARKQKPVALPLERRTLIVWGSLVTAMTLVSGLLLMIEPNPLPPAAVPVLTVLDSGGAAAETLFATSPAADSKRWQAIVIHDSGRSYGNAQTLAQEHQAAGIGGLGFHFVITNGDGGVDGEVHTGYRWTRQLPGAMISGSEADAWYAQHAIDIALVGNGNLAAPTAAQMEQLVRLVTTLQRKLNIPADRVRLLSNIVNSASPGRYFPAAAFRQQLLDVGPTVSVVR